MEFAGFAAQRGKYRVIPVVIFHSLLSMAYVRHDKNRLNNNVLPSTRLVYHELNPVFIVVNRQVPRCPACGRNA
jgi:hypothetical protein